MDINFYTDQAMRTESIIDLASFDIDTLKKVLAVSIAVGNLLDDIKKNIFYNKPINMDKWNDNLSKISNQGIELNLENKQSINMDTRLLHSILGIATEGTELLEAIDSTITNQHTTDIDTVNIREELFDVMWYMLIAHNTCEFNFEETLKMGFHKLQVRYPDKFTSDSATNRNLEQERSTLESYSS